MKGASQIAPFGLRMPEELKDKIADRARKNGRSMNAEIVQIIQDVLDASEGKVNSADKEMVGMIVKLRRHTQEQDMLLNEFVRLLNDKNNKPT